MPWRPGEAPLLQRGGRLSRGTVGAALASVCSVAAVGCSIDFVTLPIATRINVRSQHVDALRVTVDIEHTGPEAAMVRIDGEPIALDGDYSVHF